jgi:hypothetical protein
VRTVRYQRRSKVTSKQSRNGHKPSTEGAGGLPQGIITHAEAQRERTHVACLVKLRLLAILVQEHRGARGHVAGVDFLRWNVPRALANDETTKREQREAGETQVDMKRGIFERKMTIFS